MKILITGKNGFIARHLYKKLSEYDVVLTDKSDDITSTLDSFQPNVIFHLGAELYNEDDMFETNVVIPFKIIQWAREHKPKLFLFGSSSEYGRVIKPMTETDALFPDTIYEGTKAATYMLARAWSYTYCIPITYIRPFTIYGYDEKSNKFTSVLIKKYIDKSVLKLNEAVRDYVYVEDFVDALLSIMNYKETDLFNVVNIGSGKQTTNSEFVKIFQKELDYVYPVELVESGKSYDSMSWVCDTSVLNNKYKIFIPSVECGIKRLTVSVKNGTSS
jgi:nucleoside-diphosphate-sugar epimerase